MNKRIPGFTLVGILFHWVLYAQEVKFTIHGTLANASTSDSVFLLGDISKKLLLTDHKSFSYTGTLPKEGLLLIRTNHSYLLSAWVTSGNIEMTLEEYYREDMDTNSRKLLRIKSLSGPVETEKYHWFIEHYNELNKKYSSLPARQKWDSCIAGIYPAMEEFIQEHPSSGLSPYLVNLFHPAIEKRLKLLSLINKDVNQEELGRIVKSINRDTLLKEGNTIENFVQPTLNGQNFSLNSLQSKYILLEFWASDCPPCRTSNPKLRNVYDSFSKKGFDIVGISLDYSKKEWKKAVKKDKLIWTQVSDLKGWNNLVAARYSIDFIPYNILIDQNKSVIATNLSAEALAIKLKSLFTP